MKNVSAAAATAVRRRRRAGSARRIDIASRWLAWLATSSSGGDKPLRCCVPCTTNGRHASLLAGKRTTPLEHLARGPRRCRPRPGRRLRDRLDRRPARARRACRAGRRRSLMRARSLSSNRMPSAPSSATASSSWSTESSPRSSARSASGASDSLGTSHTLASSSRARASRSSPRAGGDDGARSCAGSPARRAATSPRRTLRAAVRGKSSSSQSVNPLMRWCAASMALARRTASATRGDALCRRDGGVAPDRRVDARRPALVGPAEHDAVGDLRFGEQRLLDVLRLHLEPACQHDQVAQAPADVQVSSRVELARVTGPVPAVRA